MNHISAEKLFEYFLETFDYFGTHLLFMSNQDIMDNLFEEFDANVHSFLHEDSLDVLLEKGFIDQEIYNLSLELRKEYLVLDEQPSWSVSDIKTDAHWLELMKLADLIKEKVVKS